MLEKYLPEQINSYNVLGNSGADLVTAVLAFIIFLVLFKFFQIIILARLNAIAKKTKTDVDDTLIRITKTLRPPFYSFVAFYFALRFLTLSETFEKIVETILILWVMYQIIHGVVILINYVVLKQMQGEREAGAKGASSFLSLFAKIILWSFGLLFVFSNLGIDVTSLIAGLGIGGIAIAFALQNILSDLFASFSIYFDKPFTIGDFIVFGDKSGTVEKIGIKTTRIRSSQGEEIVVSNGHLTSATIQNFRKMKERRALLNIGVTYSTQTAKLERIPKLMKEAITDVENLRFGRAHFKTFGDSALHFEIVYYVQSRDYEEFLNKNQQVNLNIKKVFESERIDMAFPTQTIYIEK